MDRKANGSAKRPGRPKKDPNAPKQTYQLSTAERARRGAQKRLRAAKKKATESTRKAEAQRDYARKLEKTIGKVEKGIKGTEVQWSTWEISPFYPNPYLNSYKTAEIVFQAKRWTTRRVSCSVRARRSLRRSRWRR